MRQLCESPHSQFLLKLTTAPTTVGMLLISGTLYLFLPSAVFSDFSHSAIHVWTEEPQVKDHKLLNNRQSGCAKKKKKRSLRRGRNNDKSHPETHLQATQNT